MRALPLILPPALLAALPSAWAGEELLRNGGFEGEWRPNASSWETGTAEGDVPEQWEDVSTWSGASTKYTRVAEGGGTYLRLEMIAAEEPTSVLQLRSGFPVTMQEGAAYAAVGRLRSPTGTVVSIEIRQHQEPRLRFWETRLRLGGEWKQHRLASSGC